MIRVGTPTFDGGGNPYLALLYTAVEAQGARVSTIDLRPWRLLRSERYDVVHIHWPEHIMVGPGRGPVHNLKAAAAAIALRASLGVLRRRGARLVWTAHNIRPHNPDAIALQVGLYKWLAKTADAVIVHTDYAAQLTRERLGRTGPIYVARHGSYLGVYGHPGSNRQALRGKYGFADFHQVLLAFGQIRAHKRLVELAGDFERDAPQSACLIIAGPPKDPVVASELRALAAASDRITLLDRYIPDAEVAELYALADLAVFNYAEIFSSGALLLALSLGRAALAPRQGTTDTLLQPPAVFTWQDSPLEVLTDALAIAPAVRSSAAFEAAKHHSWEEAAKIHIEAYSKSNSEHTASP